MNSQGAIFMSRSDIIQTLKVFKEQHAEEYGIQVLGIFGSLARDEATKDSDVDVVVKVIKQDMFNLIGIKQGLEEILHTSVDLISYREKMNPFLKKRIDKDAFMYDKDLAIEILMLLDKATEMLMWRFKPIKSVLDYTESPEGMEKLDAVCMLLIAIGESLKKLDKITNGILLSDYPEIEWKKVKGLGDIISHQYFDINAEAIYDVCDTKIKPLSDTIQKIIEELE